MTTKQAVQTSWPPIVAVEFGSGKTGYQVAFQVNGVFTNNGYVSAAATAGIKSAQLGYWLRSVPGLNRRLGGFQNHADDCLDSAAVFIGGQRPAVFTQAPARSPAAK